MSRLLILSLLLIPVFALAMGVVMLMGQMQPLPSGVQWLHLTDCSLPCWNGITPRVSSLGDAEDRIALAFPQFHQLSANSLPFQTWMLDDGVTQANINMAVDDGVVATLGIGTGIPSRQMPRLGDVLALFGAPTCVSFMDGAGAYVLSYENPDPRFGVYFYIDEASLVTPIVTMSLGASGNRICPPPNVSWTAFRRSLRRVF